MHLFKPFSDPVSPVETGADADRATITLEVLGTQIGKSEGMLVAGHRPIERLRVGDRHQILEKIRRLAKSDVLARDMR